MAPLTTKTDAGRALLRSGLLALLGFLVLTAAVSHEYLNGLDLAARALVHQSHGPALLGFMEGASYLGGQPGQVAVLVVGVVILWSRKREWALALPLVMAGAGVLQFLAKRGVDRPRPNLDPLGFPSAHVLSLVVLCGFLAYAVSIGSARRRRRHLLFGACLGVVGTVAYSRMYLDAHWFSDVLGGLTAGLAYLLVAIWVIRSVPLASRSWRRAPMARGAEAGLVPVVAGSPTESMVIAGSTAMAPATPTGNPG